MESHRYRLYDDVRVLVVESLDDRLEAVLRTCGHGLDPVAEVDDQAPVFGRVFGIGHFF